MASLFKIKLFGYEKASVNNYISKLNEEFSHKLLANDKEHKMTMETLPAENNRLKEENAKLLAAKQEIADALICAHDYAADVRQQTETEEKVKREQNTARQMAEFRRIQNIAVHIQNLHEEFQSVVGKMDEELETYKVECSNLQSVLMEQAENPDSKKEGIVCSNTADA